MALLIFVGLAGGSPAALAAETTVRTNFEIACGNLTTRDFHETRDAPTEIMEAVVMPARGKVPIHCLVEGYVWPAVGFGLVLPEAWNGKFLMMGCGGSCGSYRSALIWCDEALLRGYACAGTDQGHGANLTITPTKGAYDRLWGLNNPQAEIDHAGRGTSTAALASKEITQRFYDAKAKLSYFLGCSDGGRSAMIMAQHYPSQFDGIIALDPVMRWSRSLVQMEYNYLSVTHPDGTPIFKRADLELLHRAVLSDCDQLDGLVDGVIGDPRLCHFNPGALACRPGLAQACFDPEKVTAARKLYAGLHTSSGKQVFYGVMPGSELSGTFGFTDSPNSKYSEYYRYLLFVPDEPKWTRDQFDPDSDYKRLGVARTLYDADNPDLREFKAHGGKLIISQAFNDNGLPSPRSNIDYYETAERVIGSREQTQDFMRLFMRPAAGHCGTGPAANMVDYLSYLENWVEKGTAPDVMVAYHVAKDKPQVGNYATAPKLGDQIVFSRPLYAYPVQFRYNGRGDPNDYRNFGPVTPPPLADIKIDY